LRRGLSRIGTPASKDDLDESGRLVTRQKNHP
jgi:hypothetical protein